MRAIKEVGGNLVVAFDPNDSVGIMDSYFPDAHFFTEFERFDRHVDKLRRRGEGLDFVSVCSPNYLHDAHVRFGLRSGSHVICEKPLVLNPWNLDGLAEIEQSTGKRVSTILQLRLHPAIIELRKKIQNSPTSHYDVDLTYITSRGRWYHASWKGDPSKSGGVATNIGVHFFDMLTFVFGPVTKTTLHLSDERRMAGVLECERATVRWFLSVDATDLPPDVAQTKTTFRNLSIGGEEFEFSDGFTDLHTRSYEEIMTGRGFGLDDVRPSIEIVSDLRQATLEIGGNQHPYVSRFM
jgi:UDP-N-acetyl-2-amino-2-deoxyglucuronate dehydrogenase